MKKQLMRIVNKRDWAKMVSYKEHVVPGNYYITGPQMGTSVADNPEKYVGYVVQLRKGAGPFGTDAVLMRHVDGGLIVHSNQAFCAVSSHDLEELKGLYPEDVTPEGEDYSQPYTLDGEYPEMGPVVEPKETQVTNTGPPVQITTEDADGSKTMTVIV